MGDFSFDIPDDLDISDVGDAVDLDLADTVEIPDEFEPAADLGLPEEYEPVQLSDDSVEAVAGDEPLSGDDVAPAEVEALDGEIETELADASLQNWNVPEP
jgi:hypothetical protein